MSYYLIDNNYHSYTNDIIIGLIQLLWLIHDYFICSLVFCGVLVPPDTEIECFTDLATNSSGVCSGNSTGNMTAVACCEGEGNTLSFNNSQCLGCLCKQTTWNFHNYYYNNCVWLIVIGFNESVLNFTSDNAGLISQVNIVIKKRINANALAQFDVTSSEFSISDPCN